MVTSGKKQRSTNLKVTFPTLPSFITAPLIATIYEKPYAHDVIVLTYPSISERFFEDIKTGLPVAINIVQESRERTWYAYVSHISKVVEGRKDAEMEIHCVGATYPLKEQSVQTFSDATITSAVNQIIKEHGFYGVIDAHPTIFPQLTIAGHSYWEWMVEQAKRIGYALWADNTTIHFRNIDSMINKNATSSPLLYFENKFQAEYTQYRNRTLQKFVPLKGDNIETLSDARRVKYLSGIDPHDKTVNTQVFSPSDMGDNTRISVSDVFFTEYRSDQVSSSDSIAEELSRGVASMARFNIPAKVKCLGDPRIHPFSPVRIQGTGKETDGLWIFKDAKHTIRSNGIYEIEGTILTDGMGASYITSLRPDISWDNGIINITEALRNNSEDGSGWSSRLAVQQIAYKPDDGGYLRSPMRWEATPLHHGF